MTDLLLVGGIQGSGKTFTATRFFADRLRINLDEIRSAYVRMTRYREPTNEDFPMLPHELLVAHERRILEHHLEQGDAIVMDNTMIRPEWRLPYVERAHHHGRTVSMLFLDLPLERCLANNQGRGRVLPRTLVERFHAQRVLPTAAEGYDRLHVVRSYETLAEVIAVEFAVDAVFDLPPMTAAG